MSLSKENTPIIGIVGAGIMGRGIAQLCLQSGFQVRLYDADAAACQAAAEYIFTMLQKLVDKDKLTAAQLAASRHRLNLCDSPAGLAGCAVVIEAIVEDLAIKQQLFAKLEGIVSASTVLASNTSSLLIADIAAACQRPERVCGLHFFNPVPLMPLVEVIPGVRTARQCISDVVALVNRTGHRPVIAQDQPGFLVNHAGRAYYTEALKIMEEGIADAVAIDRVMREGLGFRMGPLELMDLTGLDVSGRVMQSVYEQFQHDPWYRPSALIAPRISAGLHGRKTGEGFYRYEEGVQAVPAEPAVPAGSCRDVWVSDDVTAGLVDRLRANGARLVDTPHGEQTIHILQFWGKDVSHVAAARQLNPALCVAVDPLPALEGRRTLMVSPVTRAVIRDSAHALLAADGVPVTVINDSPGFISQRILAMMVNIACHIVQRRIASVADLEAAVTLGLGYPQGPLAWGDAVGAGRIAEILHNIHQLTADPRYRAALWLRRRAELSLSLRAEEHDRH